MQCHFLSEPTALDLVSSADANHMKSFNHCSHLPWFRMLAILSLYFHRRNGNWSPEFRSETETMVSFHRSKLNPNFYSFFFFSINMKYVFSELFRLAAEQNF